jgi:phage terminase small subunit
MLDATMSKLTAKQEAFAVALCDPTCKGPSEAYARAGYRVDDPPTKQQQTHASALAAHEGVARRVVEIRNVALSAAMIDAAFVLREWMTIATADPSELMRARRWSCRHCYGIDHKFQWISEEEFAIACARVIDWNATKPSRAAAKPMPDYSGGCGYDRTRAPAATCPHCGGDGEWDTYIADTHSLSPAARKLFAGIKTTNNGVEVKMRDQDGALANIAKYLGMMAERHLHGGDPNNPTPIPTIDASNIDAATAAKVYAAAMGAK